MTTSETFDNTFIAAGLPTLIGSVPLNDHSEALEWIFAHTPQIPLWPQLPSNPAESMLTQFVENIPGVIEGLERTYISTEGDDFEEKQLAFFEEYIKVSEAPSLLAKSIFSTSKDRANGLYQLHKYAATQNPIAIKGQITGPFTLLTGLSDKNHKLAYYDQAIHEMIVKGLAMRAAWQVQFFRDLNLPVLLFIDEPALAGLGSSSFISISLDEIGQDITEIVQGIHMTGGLAGVHVCANTDWNFLLSLGLNIISFDAYSYFDRFVTSKNEIHHFLDKGNTIAWGIVPTSDEETITGESVESLAGKWEDQAKQLCGNGWDMDSLLKSTLITPSCGTGSLSPELARRVLELTRGVSQLLRVKYLNNT